ncbi:MAG TPA: hypothetical protein VHX66_12150 [Solirubrobacteraceae bacterium]|jgi:hypothetical protein|nr:hypothetical protein [Solirubrobacteraceae bacterium]
MTQPTFHDAMRGLGGVDTPATQRRDDDGKFAAPDTRPPLEREREDYLEHGGTLDDAGVIAAGELESLPPELQKEAWRRWPNLTEASAVAMTTSYFAAGRRDGHSN